ncbi:phosphoadenosine phosphosulfate reductase family protein [Rhodococcus sp. NPDC019627]|uniref:phosphoadenosine phosphosulfate reductase domain-containing protein n=1 Tax=unclassified Rhodococcus (in: high G+C Gram-positive bacteria) TaxID=192944 RepID=UPI00378F234C
MDSDPVVRSPAGSGHRRRKPSAVADILTRIEAHLAQHDGYVAFSGGKDSLVVLDLARRVEPEAPVVFFDSGLDYPETYDYLTELAHTCRLDLHRIPTDPPLLQVLTDSGLWDHAAPTDAAAAARVDLHEALIAEPARRAHQLLGPGELWGVRADESAARRHLFTREGCRDGIITRGGVDDSDARMCHRRSSAIARGEGTRSTAVRSLSDAIPEG